MWNNKHVFWQALIIALLIFWTGILLGAWFEEGRISKLDQFYYDSETNIFDISLQGQILVNNNFSCGLIANESIDFADRIYAEAKSLEKLDASNKITEDALRLHKRYDLLRTMLWSNLIVQGKKCEKNFNVVVYLYQYNNPSINTKAKQDVMSKVLLDLKTKYSNKVILIPIAYDTEIKSLNYLMVKYNLKDQPQTIINQKDVFTELSTVEELEKYLSK